MEEELKRLIKKDSDWFTEDQITEAINCFHEICKRNNISEIFGISSGESAIALDAGDKIVKYLPCMEKGVTLKEYIKNSDNILEILDEMPMTFYYNNTSFSVDMSFVVTEKMLLEDVSNDEVINLAKSLYSEGYIWLDIKKDNVGYDKNGKLKLFDYGELFNVKYDEDYLKHVKDFYEKLAKFETRKR